MVEQGTHNPLVVGSNPTGPTTEETMLHSRSNRMAKARSMRRKRTGLVVLGLLLAAAAVAGGAVFMRHDSATPTSTNVTRLTSASLEPAAATQTTRTAESPSSTDSSVSSASYLTYSAADSSSESTLVEVPDVVGRKLSDVMAVMSAAGLSVDVQPAGSGSAGASQQELDASSKVTGQDPAPGELVKSGALVVVGVTPAKSTRVKAAAQSPLVVCIDPGHQSRSNNAKEPVGPGSTTMKAKVTGGATGVKTRIPEYEIALQIAMNVRARLARAGVRVVMTRTTNDVNISNSERAKMANRAKANLFLRIHANGSPNSRQAGLSVLYPAVTRWTKTTSAPSRRAALSIQQSALSSTGAASDGLHARSDLAGFNWCTRPSVLVECGYMSNPVEDRLLASPKYQDKVAAGIARGVLSYLGR